jgi:DNA primase
MPGHLHDLTCAQTLPQPGGPVAVGTCGTALTPEQVGSLTRHVDTEAGVIAAFDADAGDRKAAERALHLLTPAYEQRAHQAAPVLGIEWPPGQDPASTSERPGGRDALATMLREQSRPLVKQVVEHAHDQHAGSSGCGGHGVQFIATSYSISVIVLGGPHFEDLVIVRVNGDLVAGRAQHRGVAV